MRGQFLSTADRAALDRFPPEVDPEELASCFWLTEDDQAEIVSRRYGAGGRLAAALQLGAIRLLGFVPPDLATASADVVNFVAEQVDATAEDLGSYTTRAHTLSDHVSAVERHLGFGRPSQGALEALGDWLVERALEHDRPLVLFRLACEHLKAERLIRPGITVLERLVVTARQQAIEETWHKLASHISPLLQRRLDELLEVDAVLAVTPWVWLRQEATAAVPVMIRAQISKLKHLQALGVGPGAMNGLNPNRVRHLAGLGRRMTPQALRRSDPARRYQILAATLVETLYSLTDEILELFDTALATVDRRARAQLDELRRSSATAANDTVRLFGQLGRLVLDDTIPDVELRTRIFALLAPQPLADAIARAEQIARPAGDSHIEFLRARYSQIRQHAPHVLAAFEFHAAQPDDALVAAVRLLKSLNEEGARRVPPDAPVGFVPAKWRASLAAPDGRIDRRTWELCTLFETRAALRGANLWVEHSRRYQNPANYLLPDDDWQRLRPATEVATGISLEGPKRLGQLDQQLLANLELLDATLESTDGVRIEDDRIVVPPLTAEGPDLDETRWRDHVVDLLPEVDLVDVLIEVNAWCGFLDAFTHAGHATQRTPAHGARLLAVLVANGCNLGLTTMARSAEFSPEQLTWTQNQHLRDDTVTAANTAIVNHQHALPLAQTWGTGTLSSSDGQRFPFTVRNPTARAMRRYYTGTGATIYTWTSDQHAQYGTRLIPTTVREATYVLDAIFDNETDLDIEEHTTDTAGYTDLVFGLFDLTGLRFSPRIRDLADQRLWRLPATPTENPAGNLLRHKIDPARFLDRWDDMLRVSATIRHGYTPASLLIARLQASARQNALTRAIQEYGRVIKTISILQYLHSEDHRRRIHHQLNKGESLHALRRQLFFANLGRLNRRRPDDQDLQAQCLTLLTNAVICWNTVYLAAALDHLEASADDASIRRLSPTVYEHINLYGRYDFANPTLPPTGQLRALRTR